MRAMARLRTVWLANAALWAKTARSIAFFSSLQTLWGIHTEKVQATETQSGIHHHNCVCVCVCVWEREREWERENLCVCLCMYFCVDVCECEREKECVCEWEREYARVSVCGVCKREKDGIREEKGMRERAVFFAWERERDGERGLSLKAVIPQGGAHHHLTTRL